MTALQVAIEKILGSYTYLKTVDGSYCTSLAVLDYAYFVRAIILIIVLWCSAQLIITTVRNLKLGGGKH